MTKDNILKFNRESEEEIEGFIEENQFRMLCYELLKAGFSYPSEENYELLKKTTLKELIKGEMLSFLDELPPRSDLEVSYTTYFDVIYGGRGCHLREGEYLKNKTSISKLLLECKGFYKNFGLYLKPNELPDSLDIELEFMYYLTYLLIKEFSKKNNINQNIVSLLEAQRDFLNRHLIHFIDSVRECLSKYEELDFYYKLSSFSKDFLAYDLDFIVMALSYANSDR